MLLSRGSISSTARGMGGGNIAINRTITKAQQQPSSVVKICGVTDPSDAAFAASTGADLVVRLHNKKPETSAPQLMMEAC